MRKPPVVSSAAVGGRAISTVVLRDITAMLKAEAFRSWVGEIPDLTE